MSKKKYQVMLYQLDHNVKVEDKGNLHENCIWILMDSHEMAEVIDRNFQGYLRALLLRTYIGREPEPE